MTYVVCSVCRKAERADLALGWVKIDDGSEAVDVCSWECAALHVEQRRTNVVIPPLPSRAVLSDVGR